MIGSAFYHLQTRRLISAQGHIKKMKGVIETLNNLINPLMPGGNKKVTHTYEYPK